MQTIPRHHCHCLVRFINGRQYRILPRQASILQEPFFYLLSLEKANSLKEPFGEPLLELCGSGRRYCPVGPFSVFADRHALRMGIYPAVAHFQRPGRPLATHRRRCQRCLYPTIGSIRQIGLTRYPYTLSRKLKSSMHLPVGPQSEPNS